jgi:hypothetical protein
LQPGAAKPLRNSPRSLVTKSICALDGSYATGDVLVGSDGGSSHARNQFLPHAQRIDTGVVGITGELILDEANGNGRRRTQGAVGAWLASHNFLKKLSRQLTKQAYFPEST